MRNPMIGNGKDTGIAQDRFAGAFCRRIALIGRLNIFAKKKHDVGNPFKKNARDVFRSSAASFLDPLIHTAKAESALDLLPKIDGNEVQDGTDMKTDALIAELRKMEVARKQNGPELLHDLETADPRRKLAFAQLFALSLKGKFLARRYHAIDDWGY
jgi:hypothetical protein